jgi:hypothetical protein
MSGGCFFSMPKRKLKKIFPKTLSKRASKEMKAREMKASKEKSGKQ